MISAFRRRLGTWILGAIIALVSAGLLVYLLPGSAGTGTGAGGRVGGGFAIATVGSDRILYDEFSQHYTRIMSQYRRMLGDKFDEKMLEALNLKAQVLESLVTQRVVLQRAQALGLTVTPDEVASEIKALPVFAQRGFSKQDYVLFLRQNGLTPEAFEEGFVRDLMVQKIEDLIKAGVKVSDPEVRELYDRERQQLTVEYVELTDLAKAKETADKLTVATSEGKDFKAAAQAAGLTVKTAAVGRDAKLEGVKEPGALQQAAAALKAGQMSSLVQGAGAAYLLRVVDRKLPGDAEFEKDKTAFRRQALGRKREMVFQEWVREARREAKVVVDREALGG
jgi:parvulin-like peptidyl-prolyl isomerase